MLSELLVIGIVVVIIFLTAAIIIPIWAWAEKSRNTYIRLVILGPIYIGILYRTVEDLLKSIADQKYVLTCILVLIIITEIVGFLFVFDRGWLVNLIRKKIKKI